MVTMFFNILIAILIALVIYVVFAGALRKFWVGPPSKPHPEDLETVNLSYRCGVCGAEVTMTAVPQGEILEAPRHCKEDMNLTTSN